MSTTPLVSDAILEDALSGLAAAVDSAAVEAWRVEWLGRNERYFRVCWGAS